MAYGRRYTRACARDNVLEIMPISRYARLVMTLCCPNSSYLNLKLIHRQGLSSFDLAVGKPAMDAVLSPWFRPLRGISLHQDSQICLLVQFISRTARSFALIIKQGIPAIDESMDSFETPLVYFYALTEALLILIRAHETGHFSVPAWVPRKDLNRVCLHARPGDNRTAVPVRRAEIIREYRSLFSDSDSDLELACYFCSTELDLNFYVCSICADICCPDCHRAFSVLSVRERCEEFGRLRRSGIEVVAVLKGLRAIKFQDAHTMSRVLSQGPCLQRWVSQKNEDYRKWRNSRTVYNHFRQDTLFEWEAVHTMYSILALSAATRNEVGHTDDSNVQQKEEERRKKWSDLTREWNNIFAFNPLREDFRQVCVHHCGRYLKKPRPNGDSALDSSGKLSAEFFDFLADKYEAAIDAGTGVMELLESKRFPSSSPESVDVQKENFVRNAPILEPLTRPGQDPDGGHDKMPAQTQGNPIHDSDDSSSDDCSWADSSSEPSKSIFPGRSLEDDDGIEIDLENFLGSLIEKRNSLVKEGQLTEEEDLVLNTAWNMAQAIFYQDTPQPSLKEISDKGEGYCTAPTTPVPSNGTHSSYGTPRSMSPVSWGLALEE